MANADRRPPFQPLARRILRRRRVAAAWAENATNDSIVSANEDVAAITEAAARIGSTDLSDVVLRLKAFKESFAAAGKHKQENKMSP